MLPSMLQSQQLCLEGVAKVNVVITPGRARGTDVETVHESTIQAGQDFGMSFIKSQTRMKFAWLSLSTDPDQADKVKGLKMASAGSMDRVAFLETALHDSF